MRNPKISIIVPIYKVEKFLKRCVDSLVNQTYDNIEILLVDDGSPDECPQMCDEYAQLDSRIVVIHKKNGGLSDARNEGLRVSTGDYILYVDSDDYIELDSCERFVDNLQEEADIIVGVCKEIRNLEIKYQRHTNLKEKTLYEAREYVIRSINENAWYAPAVLNLYRRNFLIENGLYYKVGFYYEDTEILPRLFLCNPKIIYMDYPFYNYMIREGSITTSGISEEKKWMKLEIYKSWLSEFSLLKDEMYKKKLYGLLVKQYLYSARELKISGWMIKGIDFKFSLTNALNIKEKIKVLLFNFFPHIYINL